MANTVISPATQRRTNSALWYGLLITLLGILSQFFYFLRPPRPISHVLPWLNLVLPTIGLIFLFVGLARAFSRSAGYSGKIWGSFVTVIALLLVAGNILLFEKTRDVPNSAGAPKTGQRLPEFTLSDSSGQPTSLSQLLSASADGSRPRAVLLVFYRGYWWPYCVLELRGIQEQLQEFQAGGVRPVAISVDSPEVTANLRRKANLTFTFLSDPNLDVIRRYGLLHVAAGPDGHDISRPAEFLVDHSGIVRWENFTEDVRVRPRGEEMLTAARDIQ